MENVWGYLLVALVFFVLGRTTGERRPRDRHLPASRVEPKPVDAPRSPAPQFSTALETELDELVVGGNLIQAIKRHREETGSDLRTAKDAISERQERLRRRGLV